MTSIVSNASPLINLAWIGQLDLLRQLYGQIIIPAAVWDEIVIKGAGQPGAMEIQSAAWIHRQEVSNHDLVRSFQRDLDDGESEAIVLAIETQADKLLMDERLGRETATYFDLRVMGVIGILIAAKQKKLIPEVKTYLDQLQSQAGFFIKPMLYQRVLKDQGELS